MLPEICLMTSHLDCHTTTDTKPDMLSVVKPRGGGLNIAAETAKPWPNLKFPNEILPHPTWLLKAKLDYHTLDNLLQLSYTIPGKNLGLS